jgi:glycine oxidase
MDFYDIAIIGGGIIGGSIAFELAQQKLRVVMLDRQQPGREASWAAAGMLAPVSETPESDAMMSLAKASFALYPEFIVAIESASGRSVEFRRCGTLHLFFTPEYEAERDLMLAALRGCAIRAEALSLKDAQRIEPALNAAARAALWLPDEAAVDPRLLTEAVLAAAAKQGAEIRAGAAVTSLVCEGTRVVGVIAAGERISAGRVIAAAGCFSSSIEGLAPYAPTRPVRGQMIALRSRNDSLRCVLRSRRGYLVPRSDGRALAGSTLENAGFEKFVTPSGMQQILAAAIELVPSLADATIVETWAGLRPDTPDHLPILGPTDIEGFLIATGHYRNGILLAPVTAKLLREWIVDGRTSLPVEQFSPLRFGSEKCAAIG